MTGPFSSPTAILDPATAPAAGEIKADGFWPALNLDHLRQVIRVDGVVTPERLRDVARTAMLDIMDELADWRAEQIAAGYETLKAVPGRRTVDDLSDYEVRWHKAVRSVVAADLGEAQLTQSSRSAGMERAEELSADVDLHRRNITFAVRDFLGRPRIIAEAI